VHYADQSKDAPVPGKHLQRRPKVYFRQQYALVEGLVHQVKLGKSLHVQYDKKFIFSKSR